MKAILLNKSAIENLVELDSIPPLKIQVLDDNNDPFDMTGWLAYLAFSEKTANGQSLKFKKAFTTTTAVSGLCEYRWANTQTVKDLDKPGKFVFDVILQKNDTPAVVAAPSADGGNTGNATPSSGGTYVGTTNATYTLEVTTGGGFGTAVLSISSTGAEEVADSVQPADGVAFAVGELGVVATFATGGSPEFVLGDTWTIQATAKIPGDRATLTKESATINVRAKLAT